MVSSRTGLVEDFCNTAVLYSQLCLGTLRYCVTKERGITTILLCLICCPIHHLREDSSHWEVHWHMMQSHALTYGSMNHECNYGAKLALRASLALQLKWRAVFGIWFSKCPTLLVHHWLANLFKAVHCVRGARCCRVTCIYKASKYSCTRRNVRAIYFNGIHWLQTPYNIE